MDINLKLKPLSPTTGPVHQPLLQRSEAQSLLRLRRSIDEIYLPLGKASLGAQMADHDGLWWWMMGQNGWSWSMMLDIVVNELLIVSDNEPTSILVNDFLMTAKWSWLRSSTIRNICLPLSSLLKPSVQNMLRVVNSGTMTMIRYTDSSALWNHPPWSDHSEIWLWLRTSLDNRLDFVVKICQPYLALSIKLGF